MNQAAAEQWIEPFAGYQFEQRQMTVDAAEQTRLIELCGIDPAIFGDCMDPAGFISLAIREGVRNRIHANGTVNMVNSVAQSRQLQLGETLTVGGEVLEVRDVPRGRVATTAVWFCGGDGKRALTSRRSSLRPDPSRAGTRGAGERPAAVIEDLERLKAVATFTLKPEQVKAYGGPHNPIHIDPVAAQRGGFRAPIIGGGHGVRFITAEIWKRFRPQALELECYFRRPIYWDDTFTVMVDEHAGLWRAICLARDGKVATEARINRLG